MTPAGPDRGLSAAGGRREARERAIELAYEAEVRELAPSELVARLPLRPAPFALELLSAVEEHRAEAEALIAGRASGWSLDRMPVIDRLVMTLAVSELLALDTPSGVVLSEAVELVGRYSNEESKRYVNGVLSAVERDLRADR